MKLQSACIAVLSGLGYVSTSNAGVTFSFASDSNPDGPTFAGEFDVITNRLSDGADGMTPVNLIVDVNGDLPGGASIFNTHFDFNATSVQFNSVPITGGFLHHWTVGGTFEFTDIATGAEVLQIDFTNATFTNVAASAGTMGNSSAVLTNSAVDGNLQFTAGTPLTALGIGSNDLALNESFAFTLTNMVRLDSPSDPLTINEAGDWLNPWVSEGSFSASATLIPAPGALALAGCALLVGRRNRRARQT